jgi:glycosyltransferase involved in cell wall biosynthesis
MTNIGFDAKRVFTNSTGLGNYARSLLLGLAKEDQENNFSLSLYSPNLEENDRSKSFFNHPKFELKTANSFFKSAWRSRGILKDLEKDEIQIYHGLSQELPFGIHKTEITNVVTAHDIIFRKYPNQYATTDRLMYHRKCQYAFQKGQHIIAISEATKKDIIEEYQIDENKIEVIYQSCDSIFKRKASAIEKASIRKKYNLPDQFILSVGSVIERKNLFNVVKAIQSAEKDLIPPLLIVGNGKSYKTKILKYIEKHELTKKVRFLENVSNEDLSVLYQQASFLVYASIYEGFGIPIIEALSSGIPVISSNISSMPEAVGKGGLLIDPLNIEDIKNKMEMLSNDQQLRYNLVKESHQHLKKFEIQQISQKYLEFYRKII